LNFRIRKGQSFLLLLVFLLLAIFRQPALLYPTLDVELAGGLNAELLRGGYESPAACAAALAGLLRLQQAACADCTIRRQACIARLDPDQGDWLSVVALDRPSGRLRNGVVIYSAGQAATAAAACSALVAAAGPTDGPVLCYPAGVPRPKASAPWPAARVAVRLLAAALAALTVSWIACGWLIRTQHLHGHLSLDATAGGPQKFHAVPTPRIGGLPILAGLLVAALVLGLSSPPGERGFVARLLLASLPAFAGGVVEDLTKRVGVTQRLLLTMAAGALAAWLLGAVLPRLAIPGIDSVLKFYPLAVTVTIVAVAGLANAFNIIDGYNGLASGSAVIVLLGLAGLALKVGDVLMLQAAGVTAAATLGFLRWNWPRGRIFLGDGGAYLLGFLLAELSVLLVMRNPSVSPWCALMLMAHPVTETLYSIWRRRVQRGRHPGHPDALHMHQLVYSRLVRHAVGSRVPADKLARNSRVAPYFWIPALLLAGLLQFCWDSSRYPVGITVLYFLSYVLMYRRLVHWQAPRWLVRRSGRLPAAAAGERDA